MRALVQSLWWIIILLCAVIAGWAFYHQRTVIVWYPATTATTVGAPSGGIASLTFQFDKVRESCTLNKGINHLWLIDSQGLALPINQRSGIPLVVDEGIGTSELLFEVPRFTPAGPATVYLEGGFDCRDALGRVWTIKHVSPKYRIEVMPSDGE